MFTYCLKIDRATGTIAIKARKAGEADQPTRPNADWRLCASRRPPLLPSGWSESARLASRRCPIELPGSMRRRCVASRPRSARRTRLLDGTEDWRLHPVWPQRTHVDVTQSANQSRQEMTPAAYGPIFAVILPLTVCSQQRWRTNWWMRTRKLIIFPGGLWCGWPGWGYCNPYCVRISVSNLPKKIARICRMPTLLLTSLAAEVTEY